MAATRSNRFNAFLSEQHRNSSKQECVLKVCLRGEEAAPGAASAKRAAKRGRAGPGFVQAPEGSPCASGLHARLLWSRTACRKSQGCPSIVAQPRRRAACAGWTLSPRHGAPRAPHDPRARSLPAAPAVPPAPPPAAARGRGGRGGRRRPRVGAAWPGRSARAPAVQRAAPAARAAQRAPRAAWRPPGGGPSQRAPAGCLASTSRAPAAPASPSLPEPPERRPGRARGLLRSLSPPPAPQVAKVGWDLSVAAEGGVCTRPEVTAAAPGPAPSAEPRALGTPGLARSGERGMRAVTSEGTEGEGGRRSGRGEKG